MAASKSLGPTKAFKSNRATAWFLKRPGGVAAAPPPESPDRRNAGSIDRLRRVSPAEHPRRSIPACADLLVLGLLLTTLEQLGSAVVGTIFRIRCARAIAVVARVVVSTVGTANTILVIVHDAQQTRLHGLKLRDDLLEPVDAGAADTDDQNHTVHLAAEHKRVRHAVKRRAVDDDGLVALAQFVEDVGHHRRLEQLHGAW